MNTFVKRVNALLYYIDLLKQLIARNLKLKYRRSFLGYLWSILNPLFIMLIMIIVFSRIFDRNVENYPVYLLTGQIMFNFMSHSTQHAIYSITGSGALLKKVYLPKYIFTLANTMSDMVDFLFSLGALFIVMLITGTPFTLYILLFPFVVIQVFLFCLGLGLFLSQANVFFRDVQYIYTVIITAWTYLTPIFYPIEILPDALSWLIKRFNPMYFYIRQFRDLVIYGRFPGVPLILGGVAYSLIMLGFGTFCFLRSQDRFILYI